MIKKGIKVKILTGKDKNKEGEVIEIDRQNYRAKIKGIKGHETCLRKNPIAKAAKTGRHIKEKIGVCLYFLLIDRKNKISTNNSVNPATTAAPIIPIRGIIKQFAIMQNIAPAIAVFITFCVSLNANNR